jgi:phosphatidate cytidylyltransferase
MTNFTSRLLVAAVGVPVVLALLWAGGWLLFALLALAALFSLHEFWLMTRSLRPLAVAGYAGAFLALLGAELGELPWLAGGVLATLPLTFVLKGLAETKTTTTVSVATATLAAAWIGGGLGFVVLLRQLPEHAVLTVFTVLLAVWANDTLAYFAGRSLGRHKLAPTVSPGKTWEGFAAGTAASVAVSFFALYDQDFLLIWQSLVLGVVIAVAGPLGDLFESALKRDMQVKDTGRVLGGHGGMLDRIDALLFVCPAVWFLLAAFHLT